MGSASIDTLTKGYAALAVRDDEGLMACLAQDVELRTLTGSYSGYDGVRQWIADMDDVWSPWQLTIGDIEEVGDRVLVEATLAGHSSRNGISMSHRFWIVWALRDGRAALGSHFTDRLQALRATESPRRLESRHS
jgi:ketosteroid isomerase-like protein